jgi:hypothetical protein
VGVTDKMNKKDNTTYKNYCKIGPRITAIGLQIHMGNSSLMSEEDVRKCIIDYLSLEEPDIEECTERNLAGWILKNNQLNLLWLVTNRPMPNGVEFFINDLLKELNNMLLIIDIQVTMGKLWDTSLYSIGSMFSRIWFEHPDFKDLPPYKNTTELEQRYVERIKLLYKDQAKVVKKALDEIKSVGTWIKQSNI